MALTEALHHAIDCVDCERGFNTNDRTNHICQGRRCSACGRFDCRDYVRGTRPTDYCTLCHCKFYGGNCKRHHVVTRQCQSVKTCLKCQAQYMVVPDRRHKCGHAKCPVCQEWVSIQDHKCYIQPVVEDEEPEPTEEGGGCMVAPPPPLFVYADFEAMQNAEGVFVANLLCYSSSEEATIHVLDGEDCALQFLHDLDDLTEVPDRDDEREILVVFHNLKGFDGKFILHELYQQQREVVDLLTVGAKVLSFKSGPLKFIDSLCFLPMPLASFPSTFNLTELKKGFFPHLFNTPDHQQYVGRIPDLEFYDPDGMMAKKEDELTRWHADQVRRNVPFHFQQEMIEYCKSDVALLKAGCEAFQQEFERQAGFNPMAKCITIASACNLYWRKHHLTPNTIAVEPLGGWRGAKDNQSLKALQWLYYQEHQIPKQGASADRIRHVRNGGEQFVRTLLDAYFVDGYDPLTRTVYEFHGCLYHGCPRCYPSRRAKHYAVPDRSVEELYQATLSKRMALLRAGYTVIEMWECEWDRLVDNEPAVSQFLRSFDLVAPLEPREAFFGSRTGAVVLHAVAGEGEEIRYVHVTSLPVGEQELPLLHRSSADHHATRRSVPGVVFWYRHGGHSSPCWFVPPRLARAQWPKTHLSSLPHLCPGRAGPTHVDQNPLLPSFRRRSHATWDLVHARAGQSRGKGVHPGQDPRSLAFSPRATPNRSLQGLCQYLVKVKTRIGGVAQLVPDRGAETGGDPTGYCQHCQKSRSQGYRQAHAEQLLGQIR